MCPSSNQWSTTKIINEDKEDRKEGGREEGIERERSGTVEKHVQYKSIKKRFVIQFHVGDEVIADGP